MFTGLVQRMGTVQQIVSDPPGVRLVIEAGEIALAAQLGDSIAVSGCCLTVVEKKIVEKQAGTIAFDAGSETLSRTNLGNLTKGSLVNLERSLRVGDKLGGHFVMGHIDAVGTLHERIDDKDWSTFWFNMPKRLAPQMVSKGSIAVDGVSLTLVEVTEDRFSVALIPHTLSITTLGRLKPGDQVNLESDMLAKYVEKQLQSRLE